MIEHLEDLGDITVFVLLLNLEVETGDKKINKALYSQYVEMYTNKRKFSV